MKIYIVTDSEGLSGVSSSSYISEEKGRPDLIAESRKLLAAEINACVEGCVRGGATEIVVRDGHGGGQNVTRAMIDGRADLIGGQTPGVLLADLEGSAGLILLGYHAMAGTPGAVCEHTMSSKTWQNVWINGRKTGEIGICAYVAGEHGVPVIMVSGDDKACAEAAEWLPEAVTCQVKKGFSCDGARIPAPEKSLSLITAKAEEAVRKAARCPLLKAASPVTMRLELVSRNRTPVNPAYRILDARTWELTQETVEKAFFFNL
ncbi:MAG: M55 family metallopeptidase [Lentisphaeria bacterium]|nr:M55 family metallopeptidase [Lentisphaeria bacterium]